MAPALLIAVDATAHIHLIIGSNPLASARCARSVEVGAKPILIAPAESTLHYSLQKRIDDGEVQWVQRSFKEDDLTSLGRVEVDGVVDAVFVTAGGKQMQGRISKLLVPERMLIVLSRYPNLQPMSPPADPSERRRCPESMFLHPPIYPFRWALTNRRYNIWKGLQAICKNTTGDRSFTSTASWRGS
jgi:hypothetical protein